MREIRVHGDAGRYRHTRIGVGGRMDTIQCAVVLAKLERFEWEIKQRREIARRYDAMLAQSAPAVQTVKVKPECASACAQYTIVTEHRGTLQTALQACGIPAAVHYPIPLHRQPAYQRYCEGARLTVSETLAARVLSLPMYPDLQEDTQNIIGTAVKTCVATAAQ